jgi:hypothetical protein
MSVELLVANPNRSVSHIFLGKKKFFGDFGIDGGPHGLIIRQMVGSFIAKKQKRSPSEKTDSIFV